LIIPAGRRDIAHTPLHPFRDSALPGRLTTSLPHAPRHPGPNPRTAGHTRVSGYLLTPRVRDTQYSHATASPTRTPVDPLPIPCGMARSKTANTLVPRSRRIVAHTLVRIRLSNSVGVPRHHALALRHRSLACLAACVGSGSCLGQEAGGY